MSESLNERELRARALFHEALSLQIFDVWMEHRHSPNYAAMDSIAFQQYKANTGIDLKAVLCRGIRPVVVFGAGGYGWSMYETLKNLGNLPTCFADNNPFKQGTVYYGLPVLAPLEMYRQYPDALVLIAATSMGDIESIFTQLEEIGFLADQVIPLSRGFGTQYFDQADLPFNDDGSEIFVDAGSLNGSDSILFAEACKGKYGYIHIFEPDPENYKLCCQTLKELPNCKIYPVGLWHEKNNLCFVSNVGCSYINEEGDNTIQVMPLDDILRGEPVSFIKMDIEGSEMNALRGASNTIRQYRPKLAICVYHRPEDPVDIPLYLNSLCPDYQFKLRHYAFGMTETVLYAF